jgi:uncharacterized protein (TIGR02147 family)
MNKDLDIPSVYAYNDFRRYLRDYQVARMNREPGFTKSEFSRLLRLPNTRSYFTDVLQGKKVTETFVDRFMVVIGFSREESQYFRTLIRFNQAENSDERELFFEQLIDLNKTPSTTLDKSMMCYYSTWHNSIIRALLEIGNFTDDYAALAKKVNPPITTKDAKQAVVLLLDLGMIRRNEEGFLKPTDSSIKAPEAIREELVRQYQLACLSLAQKTVVGKHAAFSYTNTISISEQGQQRLIKLLEKFQSQVRSLVHKDEERPDRVLHLNIILGKHSNEELSS